MRLNPEVHVGVNRAYGKGRRYYSPTLARWLSRDPIGGVHRPALYAYGENSSVGGVDPIGLDIIRFSDMPHAVVREGHKGSEYKFVLRLVCANLPADAKDPLHDVHKYIVEEADRIEWGFRPDGTKPPAMIEMIPKPPRTTKSKRIWVDYAGVNKQAVVFCPVTKRWTASVGLKAHGDYECQDPCSVLRWVQEVYIDGVFAGHDGEIDAEGNPVLQPNPRFYYNEQEMKGTVTTKLSGEGILKSWAQKYTPEPRFNIDLPFSPDIDELVRTLPGARR